VDPGKVAGKHCYKSECGVLDGHKISLRHLPRPGMSTEPLLDKGARAENIDTDGQVCMRSGVSDPMCATACGWSPARLVFFFIKKSL
jgi:hypothetical protein